MSKLIFNDARVLAALEAGSGRITVARLKRAALKLQQMHESKEKQ